MAYLSVHNNKHTTTNLSCQERQFDITNLPDRKALNVLERKARATRLRAGRLRRQLLPLLTLASVLLDHEALLAAVSDRDDLNVHALLHGLLKTRDHGAESVELVESKFAVEHDVCGLASVEMALMKGMAFLDSDLSICLLRALMSRLG